MMFTYSCHYESLYTQPSGREVWKKGSFIFQISEKNDSEANKFANEYLTFLRRATWLPVRKLDVAELRER